MGGRLSWPDAGLRRAGVGALMGVAVVATASCAAPSPSVTAREQTTASLKPIAVPGLTGCAGLERGSTNGDESAAKLPGVELSCLTDRRRVDVSRLGGKPVLVNLWASWCGPCRKEMPRLAQASRTTPGVQFLGINTSDDPDAAAAFLDDARVPYPQLVDLKGVVLDFTRVPGLPVTLALDSEGRVVDKIIGEVSEIELSTVLNSLEGQ